MDNTNDTFLSSIQKQKPSQVELDQMMIQADRILIIEGNIIGDRLQEKRVAYTCTQVEDLAAFRACLRIDEQSNGFHCMCPGQWTFVFFQGEEQLAVIGYHHGVSIRWHRWQSDVYLREKGQLLGWLSAHGVTGPEQLVRENIRRQQQAEEAWQQWKKYIPACLTPFAHEMKENSSKTVDCDLLRRVLEEWHSDTMERVRLLVAWYGKGSGSWSSYPLYEDVPVKILLQMPVDELIFTTEYLDQGSPEMTGAARYFSSGHFAKHYGHAWLWLSRSLAQRLLEHVMQKNNEENKRRAQSAFQPAKL